MFLLEIMDNKNTLRTIRVSHIFRKVRKKTLFVALIAILAYLLLACTPADWSAYSSINLIGSRDLDSGNWITDDSTVPAVPPGGSGDFMIFQEDGTETPPSGVSGPVYRLGLHNLLIDGDFEASTVGSPPNTWSSANSPTTFETINSAVFGSQAMDVEFGATNRRIFTDLSANLSSGYAVDTTFAFHMDFAITPSTFGIEMNNGAQAAVQNLYSLSRFASYTGTDIVYFTEDHINSDNTLTTNGNKISIEDASYSNFSFGGFHDDSQKSLTGEIDNIRIVRSDLTYFARLPVPLEETGRPALPDGGTYSVSIWLKPDPDVTPSTQNEFPSQYVSLGINTTPGVNSGVSVIKHDVSSLSGWTKITSKIDGVQIPVAADATDTILEFVIEPTYSQGGPLFTDAGNILIAGPELTWSPN